MSAPHIHGMGRIMFRRYHFTVVPVSKIKEIPGGPPKDEAFIAEGVEILRRNRWHDLPPITVWNDPLDDLDSTYWIIDGRHRFASYEALAEAPNLDVILGEGMIILPKG